MLQVGDPVQGWSGWIALERGMTGECTPTHVHIAIGPQNSMAVQWTSTCNTNDSAVRFRRVGATGFTTVAAVRIGTLRGKPEMLAVMASLESCARYEYMVGAGVGWSQLFQFQQPGVGADERCDSILTILAVGCLGFTNAPTLPRMQAKVASGGIGAVFLLGDMAYDLDTAQGAVGDQFLTEVEAIAAYSPTMVAVGNHEAAKEFEDYTVRFQNMPATNGTIATAGAAGLRNNWFYSFDIGPAHIVVLSTEVYFTSTPSNPGVIQRQLEWLTRDLQGANQRRGSTPWLIALGHRPLYCTTDADCDADAATIRGAFEDLFHKFGVDLYLCAHQHNYERTFDLYRGSTARTTKNMRATTQILSGAGGTAEYPWMRKPFLRDAAVWDAARDDTFSYSQFELHNATHIKLQQFQADPLNPQASAKEDVVIDEIWLVQENHGPFEKIAG